jgi:hypothetical protein
METKELLALLGKPGRRLALCVVCDTIIGTDLRRRYCGPACRVREGRGTLLDHIVIRTYNRNGRPVTATHEAAHAVAGRALGWPVDETHIVPSGKALGETTFIGHLGRLDNDPPMDVVMVNLAGLVAEAIRDGRDDLGPIVDAFFGPWTGDEDIGRSRYYVYAGTVDGDEAAPHRFVRDAVERAAVILRGRWAEVERLATALLERERLTGSDVDAVLSAQAEADRGITS